MVWRVLVLISLLVRPGAVSGEELSDDQREQIAAVVTDLQRSSEAPGVSVAVACGNQLRYAQGFGLADLEHQVPVSETTCFRTASIAKSMTAVLVMKLAEEGKVDLDADVQDYVPDYPEKRWPVSSRQLLGHLGGVRHYRTRDEATSTAFFPSLKDALQVFKDDPLLHEPGTRFRYTTFGYNLVGTVAEAAGGRNFEALLAEKIFHPAGMHQTVVDRQSAIIPGRSRGYIIHRLSRPAQLFGAQPATGIRNAPLHDTSMKIPGGGLLSTPADLVRFATAVNQERLCSHKSVQQMWTEQQTAHGKATGYGLGWKIGRHDGRRLVSHTGGQAGTSTILTLYPDCGVSVALMCNLQNVSLSAAARAIAEVVLPAAQTDYAAAVERLDKAFQYELEAKQIPAMSVALVDGNRTVWSRGYGFQDAEKRVRATSETVYRVGSISKLFTDVAVMQLVEEGRLKLDEPVSSYLPDFKPDNPFSVPLTLRQLMSHQSGLVRESPVGHYFDPTEPGLRATVASLNKTRLVYPPETRTKYSNAAVSVVGRVLEAVLDESHPERVQRKLLDPLQMRNSSFVVTERIRSGRATGWMWTYDGRRFQAPDFLLGTGPAGNMYSSVDDLIRFVSCLLDHGKTDGGQILQSESLVQMTTPVVNRSGETQNFGLGFHIGELDGQKKIGHGGAVYGYSTQLEMLPDRNLGVVVASALDGSNGVAARLANYALRLMLAVQDGKSLPTYRVTGPVPETRAKELVGRWSAADGSQPAQITELNGRVFLQRGTFRHELKLAADDGTILTDDPIGFGTSVQLESSDKITIAGKVFARMADQPPPEPSEDWEGLIGEYGWDHNVLYILEQHGRLYALIEWFYFYPLEQIDRNTYAFPDYGLYHGEHLKFHRLEDGSADFVVAAEVRFDRRAVGTRDGETFRITPVRPIDELRQAALSASPPAEAGKFRAADLVKLNQLDPTIALDIRYASTNNFTGSVFYRQGRAFMQRPAAEAVVRSNARLKSRGLGLLVHDAYRPWHVTKMFWDATPEELKDFVADPQKGSRHNRGCAVDLTLYDLKTRQPVRMVAGYDEFSPRSFPLYPGGTSRQRWYRDLLRRTMEAEAFQVYEFEWWHFDYQDWRNYRIGNATFETIAP